MANDFTPIFQNDLEPLVVQFVDASLTPIALTNLSGAAISMTLQNTKTAQVIACQGAWTVISQPLATASYQWLAGETATVGLWNIEITVGYQTGTETFGPDTIPPLEIRKKF